MTLADDLRPRIVWQGPAAAAAGPARPRVPALDDLDAATVHAAAVRRPLPVPRLALPAVPPAEPSAGGRP